jgi:acetyl-CoA acetyltransferase
VLIADGINAYSGPRPTKAGNFDQIKAIGSTLRDYYAPFGIATPPQWYSVMARRHLDEYKTPPEALGAIAIACRRHAQLNDKALMRGRPITMEEYLNSPYISEPYRLLDCCLESDGAAAVIVAAANDREAVRAHTPVLITAVAQDRADPPDDIFNRDDVLSIGLTKAAPRAWEAAGVGPSDMDFAQIYDCFTFEVLQQLEEAGFCPRGEGRLLTENGNLELGGRLPLNTSGGLLSEAYLMGMNHILEATLQLRHEAGGRQVSNARHGVVTGFGDFCDGSIAVLRRGA